MNIVQIPASEYQRLKEELALLKDTELLQNFNKLVDFLYQDKYGPVYGRIHRRFNRTRYRSIMGGGTK